MYENDNHNRNSGYGCHLNWVCMGALSYADDNAYSS